VQLMNPGTLDSYTGRQNTTKLLLKTK